MRDLEVSSTWGIASRTIAINGASGMLGRKVFNALLECGANVAAIVRDPSRARFLLETQGEGRLILIKADVLDKESLVEEQNKIENEFAGLYGLLNFAGWEHA